ncbi:MAG: lipid-A-disaccharide synthase, partial [Pseudomonadota bacterium]
RADIDLSSLSVLGLTEGLLAYRRVRRLVREVAADILEARPKLVVLVDSWGFTLRVAQTIQAAAPHIRLVKLIGPQVWATRPGRAKTLAETVDHLLCIHDFEEPFYEPHGLKTTVIGHPALQRLGRGDAAEFRARFNLEADAPLLAIFPGSRVSEINRMGPALLETAVRMKRHHPDLNIVFAPSNRVAQTLSGLHGQNGNGIVVIDETLKFDLMAAADLAIAVSGTVTTEIAAHDTPVITGYRTGTITFLLAKHILMKAPFISLVNMAAGEGVMPELIQDGFTADALVTEVERLLREPNESARRVAAQNEALSKMGAGQRLAAEVAANAILSDYKNVVR